MAKKKKPGPGNPDAGDEIVRLFSNASARCPEDESCGLKHGIWGELPIWQCPVCQFQTFDQAEAASRAAAAGIPLSADLKTENSTHG